MYKKKFNLLVFFLSLRLLTDRLHLLLTEHNLCLLLGSNPLTYLQHLVYLRAQFWDHCYFYYPLMTLLMLFHVPHVYLQTIHVYFFFKQNVFSLFTNFSLFLVKIAIIGTTDARVACFFVFTRPFSN